MRTIHKTADVNGDNIEGIISADNSSILALSIGETYTGNWEETELYSSISILVIIDTAGGEIATLNMDLSIDQSFTRTKTVLVSIDSTGVHTIANVSKYFRIRIEADQTTAVNGAVQVILHKNRTQGLISFVSENISDNSDCTVVKSILTAKDSNGDYQNLTSDSTGQLIVESVTRPMWDGVGFKGTNSDGTVGIVVDGRRYLAQELVQEVDEIFLVNKSAVPLLGSGDFIKIMSEPEAPQIVSSSIADSGSLDTGATLILIQGWVINPTTFEWSIGIDLFVPNGQTPASGLFGTLFIRLMAGQAVRTGTDINVDSFDNACHGSMYLISAGEPITGGIPDTLNDSCFLVSRAGSCVFYCAYVSSPPTAQTLFSEHILGAISSGQTLNIKASYYIRTVVTGLLFGQPNAAVQNCSWKRAALLTLLSNNGSISAHQSSFPDLNGSIGGDQCNDMTVLLTRVDGNTSSVLAFSNLTGNYILDSTYGI